MISDVENIFIPAGTLHPFEKNIYKFPLAQVTFCLLDLLLSCVNVLSLGNKFLIQYMLSLRFRCEVSSERALISNISP